MVLIANNLLNDLQTGSYSYPFPIDANDADGYCDLEAGEVCVDRLLTDVSNILPFNNIAQEYQSWFNSFGYTCGDAMILRTNDNSNQEVLFWDNNIDTSLLVAGTYSYYIVDSICTRNNESFRLSSYCIRY